MSIPSISRDGLYSNFMQNNSSPISRIPFVSFFCQSFSRELSVGLSNVSSKRMDRRWSSFTSVIFCVLANCPQCQLTTEICLIENSMFDWVFEPVSTKTVIVNWQFHGVSNFTGCTNCNFRIFYLSTALCAALCWEVCVSVVHLIASTKRTTIN